MSALEVVRYERYRHDRYKIESSVKKIFVRIDEFDFSLISRLTKRRKGIKW